MPRMSLFIVLFLLPFFASAAEEGQGGGAIRPRETLLRALPRVPSRETLLDLKHNSGKELDRDKENELVRAWVSSTIAAKEKRADVELAAMKKKILDERQAELSTERERQRRQEKLDESWGVSGARSDAGTGKALHIQLDFQVPEIDSYRAAAEACKAREALANEIVARLPRLNSNADSQLVGDDYRAAAALLAGSARLFQKLDSNGDGFLTAAKLSAARELPENAAAALRDGRAETSVANYRIKPFDANSDGILDVAERKALTMAFVECAMKAANDAAFYTRVADMLAASRQPVANKFADVEIVP